MDLDKATETYNEEINQGNAAFMLSENKVDKDVIKMQIGNVLPGE
jgi:hypothetical protein